jgi:hypothetical protein
VKSLRSVVIVLVWAIALLTIAETAAASQGNGGKGDKAAVGIDTILLINPSVSGDDIIAEISGGGFLGGDFVEVTLDGAVLATAVVSEELLVSNIPATTPEGDHTIMVRIGDTNKQNASATIRLGGVMTVSCISWFKTGPAKEHVHTEVHVEDENREAVIGATVTWTAENDTVGIYQTNVSPTGDIDGHGHGANCDNEVSGSGVTGWFCCIGAGKWDAETPPGKRACNEGLYTAKLVDVTAPPFTNMTWDGVEVEASITLEDTRFP